MQAVEYYLTHDYITFSTEPKISVYATNPQFKKICLAIANNDWIYVHGLLSVVKQEQRLSESRHGFSIHSDEVLFNDRSVNYLLRLAIMVSIHDKQTQPSALFEVHKAMETLVNYLEAPLSGQAVNTKQDEIQDEIYRDLEESSDQEMLASLEHSDDSLDYTDSWGNTNDSWYEFMIDPDVGQDGIPGGMSDDYVESDANHPVDYLDGGSFIQKEVETQPNINADLENLRQEYLKNKEDNKDER